MCQNPCRDGGFPETLRLAPGPGECEDIRMSVEPSQGFVFLRSLIHWQNRPEGAFIEVLPDAVPVDEQELFRAFLAAGVVNANAATIAAHVREKSEGWQRVGKAFEFKDGSPKVLQVRVQDLSASVWIDPPLARDQGRILTVEEIGEFLKANGVSHGIDPDLVQMLLRPNCAKGWYDVALGDPPVDGTDAKIECRVNLEQSSIPQPTEDGTVDFHDRGVLPEVTAGTAIYVKIPGRVSKDGVDLAGNVIPAKKGIDVSLVPTEGTRLREGDSYVLEAAWDGFLFLGRDGRVNVGRVFNVKGDLDLQVGNIKYHGPVHVGGNVPSGFRIHAGGDITVMGTAENADIHSSGGSIEIRGGVFGGKIHAVGEIKVAFAHEAELVAGGVLDGGKYLQHCQTRCTVLKFSRGGMVVGGQVLASREVECDVLGTEAGTPTIVNLTDPDEEDARQELERTILEEKKIGPLRDLLEQKVVALKQRLGTGAQLLGRAREDAEETLRQYASITEKFRDLERRRLHAQEILAADRAREGVIQVRKAVYTGVDVHIFGKRFEISEVRPPVKVIVKDREVEAHKI